jgi:hypothetical protein
MITPSYDIILIISVVMTILTNVTYNQTVKLYLTFDIVKSLSKTLYFDIVHIKIEEVTNRTCT